jgi:hypothetical protein
MTEETLDAIIERKYRELLDDAKEPTCQACGRKPMTQATLVQALRGAVQWHASKTPPPNGGGAPGSALREEDPEDG